MSERLIITMSSCVFVSPRLLLNFQSFGVILTVLQLILNLFAHTEDDMAKYKLKVNSIVPIIIPTMPEHKLSVVYKHAKVNFGNKVNGYEMMDQPSQVSWPAENGFYYTLFMIGPDSPVREQPMDKNWLHWLVTNIPGAALERGDVIAEYCGSLAGYEIGLHRLIYAVYENPNRKKIKFDEPYLNEDADYAKRTSFDLLNFTRKYNITKPIAANFAVLDLDFRLPGT